MTGLRAPWLVSLPVALAGCLAAHLVAYALATPSAHAHDSHGYLDYLPLVGGAALAVVLGAALRHAIRGGSAPRPSPWLFALLPPLAFTLQEHVERLAQPALVVAEPTFLLGLALQLPFAALAWLLARAILRAADALGALLAPPPRPRPRTAPRQAPPVLRLPRLALTTPVSQRGPPAALAIRP
jgi:hypothetical protein